MRRVAALPLVLATFFACATSRTGELEPRYVAVHNAMAAMGLAQVGPIQQGSLAEGRETRLRLDLGAQCTTIVALGGSGVRDLDLALLDADDKPVARDTTKDAQAAIRTCPDRAGKFTLVVKMGQGAGDFLAATWAGGAAGGSAPATGDGGAATATGAGTCESPIPITVGTVSGNTHQGESEHAGSCVSSSSSEIVYLLDVQRRQRVVLEVDATFDSVLYLRRDACADDQAEVACNDDANTGAGSKRSASNRASRLDEVLEPGKYWVFVDGYNTDAGGYRLKTEITDIPALAEVCRTARPLGVQKVSSQLGNAFDNVHASCGEDAKGPDVLHRFDVAQRSRVRITSTSSDFQPVVHLRKQCSDEKSEVGCEASGFGTGEATFVGVLDPASYTVFADSSEKEAHGRFTLEAETAPESGTGVPNDGCVDALPLSLLEKRVEGDTFRARDDIGGRCTGAGMPDVVYRFELTKRSRVTAHFATQEGAHVFVVARTCGDRTSEVACTANVDEILGPGIYSLAVDGSGEDGLGRYAFTFAARDVSAQENACKAPPVITPGSKTTGTTVGAGDKFMATCAGREDAQASADRVFRFDLKQRTRVQLLLSTPTHDGVLALRRSCMDPPRQRAPRAAEISCNNDYQDNRHSRIESTLEPGTYFVVVEGNAAKNDGTFTLEYKHVTETTPAKPPPPRKP